MFEVRNDLLYTEEHEWISVQGNKAKFGMTDFAQHELGNVVYVDLPAVGTHITYGEEIGSMESVKSIEPVYGPISGTIVEINTALEESAELINKSPYDDGWMAVIEIDDVSEKDRLMKSEEYGKKVN